MKKTSSSLRCRAYQRKKSKAKAQQKTRIFCVASIAVLFAALVACTTAKPPVNNGNEYTVVGTFAGATNEPYGKYYHFKSDDNTVWWALTERQLEFVPELDKSYILVYNDMGTNDIYDDQFVTIAQKGGAE